MNPSSYPIGTAYGVRGDHWTAGYHTGVDYLAPIGSKVVAPCRSRIIYAGRDTAGSWGPAYGLHVVGECEHAGETFRWIVAHLSDVASSLRAGVLVAEGYPIALSGNSGNVTGPHVHFEVRHDPFTYGCDVDPADLVDQVPATPVLNRQIDQLGRAIAASRPGRVRRLRRTARQALLQARAIIRGRA